ncbi:hypothetical protein DMC30DRAFT_120463 [Rhodotorula diobovata]|uniref:Uncharacterized protein n=1 Tax=Rhodotorula diobovata TaxID=5288 RepID=A0A5C5FKV0_9BASI|nr:hypothetical protein DMC30DRAFT_120463 [Rhodotorula diobovata]
MTQLPLHDVDKLRPLDAKPAVYSPLTHAPTTTTTTRQRGTTPAASLPTELLLRIFELMPMMYAGEVREDLVAWTVTSTCPDLPKVARVCRGWRTAAQLSLFHSVSLIRRKHVLGFLDVARRRPDLAQRVAAMHIGLVDGTPELSEPYERQVEMSDLFIEALTLVPNVRHLLVNQMRKSDTWRFIDVLEQLELSTLALKLYDPNTSNRETAVLVQPSDVYRAFSLPTLRAFELNFRPTWPRRSDYAVPVVKSNVECMSVTVNAPKGLIPMLSAAGPSLVRLNIYTEHVLNPEAATTAFSTLVNLRELRFESNVPALSSDAAPPPAAAARRAAPTSAGRNDWLEPLLPLYTRLQRLSISEQAASATFLGVLPRGVAVAEYISWDRRPDTVLCALEDALLDSRARGRADAGAGAGAGEGTHLALPRLVLAVDEEAFEESVDEADLERVVKAFAARGCEFAVAFEPMDVPQLRWVDT